jgi:hypothetical protein
MRADSHLHHLRKETRSCDCPLSGLHVCEADPRSEYPPQHACQTAVQAQRAEEMNTSLRCEYTL